MYENNMYNSRNGAINTPSSIPVPFASGHAWSGENSCISHVPYQPTQGIQATRIAHPPGIGRADRRTAASEVPASINIAYSGSVQPSVRSTMHDALFSDESFPNSMLSQSCASQFPPHTESHGQHGGGINRPEDLSVGTSSNGPANAQSERADSDSKFNASSDNLISKLCPTCP
ncbi:hypothetical protein N7470_006865 [Penicillium chermesinum]|nr:hypothetical protein N7470_006865 [Penicillium chermesinum]